MVTESILSDTFTPSTKDPAPRPLLTLGLSGMTHSLMVFTQSIIVPLTFLMTPGTPTPFHLPLPQIRPQWALATSLELPMPVQQCPSFCHLPSHFCLMKESIFNNSSSNSLNILELFSSQHFKPQSKRRHNQCKKVHFTQEQTSLPIIFPPPTRREAWG